MTDRIKPTLLPCPFCGGDDIRIDAHPHVGRYEHEGETVYSMCCYACGAGFPNRYKRQLLVDAWDRRAATAEIERLRAALVIFRSLVREGGVPRYTVTSGAALNAVIEEVVDPILREAT
jgi:Lar family restriction alleviation protein